MKRIKIAVVAAVAVIGAFGASLGARALPMSDYQRGCENGGGAWTEWVDFVETDPGHFEGYLWGVCSYIGNGYSSTTSYMDGEWIETCIDYENENYDDYCSHKRHPEPDASPTPTSPTTTTTGGSSGTVQPTAPTSSPTPTTTTTSTGTTTRTASR